MVRIITERIIEGNKKYIQAAGPSGASKPTSGIVSGSFFIETDTGYVYVFNESSSAWTKM